MSGHDEMQFAFDTREARSSLHLSYRRIYFCQNSRTIDISYNVNAIYRSLFHFLIYFELEIPFVRLPYVLWRRI